MKRPKKQYVVTNHDIEFFLENWKIGNIPKPALLNPKDSMTLAWCRHIETLERIIYFSE